MKEKTIYYSDPLHDDFAGTNIKQKPLAEDYEYLSRSRLRRGCAWVLHHLLATPICFLALKLLYRQKIVGREKLKPYRKSGYFLYGNHTRAAGDAFTPSMVAFPRKPYLIVNPDAVSIKGLKRIVEDLGAMPVPDSLALRKKFCEAVVARAEKGEVIAVYPEAHIWPFYAGIRPFPATSFSFPVNTKKPAFAFTTTYQKRKLFFGVRTTVYLDGPFYPDEALSGRERKENLRSQIFSAMEERSKLSTYSPYRYLERREPCFD